VPIISESGVYVAPAITVSARVLFIDDNGRRFRMIATLICSRDIILARTL